MYIQSFYKLLSVASSLKGEHTMAVVRADDEDVLDAVVDAQEAHMARSILIGDTAKIQRILEKHRKPCPKLLGQPARIGQLKGGLKLGFDIIGADIRAIPHCRI